MGITSILPTAGGKPAQQCLDGSGRLWVVNFGADGSPSKPYGLECYDIATDPAHPKRLSFTGSPSFVWFTVEDIQVAGATLFAVANGPLPQTLRAVDISVPSAPTNLGSINLDGQVYSLALSPSGTTAIVAQSAGSGLRVVDVTLPGAMAILASVAGSFIAVDTTLWPYVLASNITTGRLEVYDLTVLATPVLVGFLALSANIRRMVVDAARRIVYLATTTSQVIYVIGIGNVMAPVLVTTIPCSIAGDDTPIRLTSWGEKTLLVVPMNAQDFNPASLWVFDVADVSVPVLAQVFVYGNILFDCLVVGDYAYLCNRGGGQELVAVTADTVLGTP